MICISINQESRRFALVDMLNAGPQCDLLEVRLDRFDNAANVAELLAHKPRPVIMSCRRVQDGGAWEGKEAERLALLRQCVVDRADYVEIELDVADQIRPFPPAKRVISYTNLEETPDDLPEIYARALTKHPDVIKLAVPTRTPEEVWPVVRILAKPAAPTVVVGLGQPGIMLALLARKMGSPWTYAALERGMEAYDGQPTVADLKEIYHHDAIRRTTPLVGVTGFGEAPALTTALLNAALANLNQPTRCLPLAIGDLRVFRKVLEAIKLESAVIDAEHQSAIREVVPELKPSAKQAEAVDFMTLEEGKWQGYHLLGRASLAALEQAFRSRKGSEKPLQGRIVMLVGLTGPTRVLVLGIQQLGGIPILAARDTNAAEEMAKGLGCRFIRLEAAYTTLHDVLVRCDRTELQGNYLKPGMTVLDLTALPRPTPLLQSAAERGCVVVSPQQVLLELVARQTKAITGEEVERAPLAERIRSLLEG